MQILQIGLSHETAAVEVRECLAFQPDHLSRALAELKAKVDEAIILSTCNRVEIYVCVQEAEAGLEKVKRFLADFHEVDLVQLEKYLKIRVDGEAVRHLFAVASSIKSMVLGENQIQAQIKQAFDIAKAENTIGPALSQLFQMALSVGKRVRNETAINEYSLSVSNAAVRLVETRVPDLSSKTVLVVGSGKMGSLAVKSLMKIGVHDLVVMNRTGQNAHRLANEAGVRWSCMAELENELAGADVVISSTGSPGAVLTEKMVARALQGRARPLFLVDIAVPRDIEPKVAELPEVTLCNVDDLKSSIENNREKRARELHKVEAIVQEECSKFSTWTHGLKVKPVITGLRNLADNIRERELQRALRRMEGELSDSDSKVIRELTNRIVNKMLHQPLVRLREEAGVGNGVEYAHTVQSLFGLTETHNSVSNVESKQAV